MSDQQDQIVLSDYLALRDKGQRSTTHERCPLNLLSKTDIDHFSSQNNPLFFPKEDLMQHHSQNMQLIK